MARAVIWFDDSPEGVVLGCDVDARVRARLEHHGSTTLTPAEGAALDLFRLLQQANPDNPTSEETRS